MFSIQGQGIPEGARDIAAAVLADAQLVLEVRVQLRCKILIPELEQRCAVLLRQVGPVLYEGLHRNLNRHRLA